MVALGRSPNSVTIWGVYPPPVPGAPIAGRLLAFVVQNASVVTTPFATRLDTVASVGVTEEYTVSAHPVEQHVAQDVIRQPVKMDIKGTISATPLGLGAFIPPEILQREVQEPEKLSRIARLRGIVVAVTPSVILPSCVITSLSRRGGGGGKTDISISLQEVVYASPLQVASALDEIATASSHYGETPAGGTGTAVDPGGLGV